jgi:hypothetical protein
VPRTGFNPKVEETSKAIKLMKSNANPRKVDESSKLYSASPGPAEETSKLHNANPRKVDETSKL